MRFSVVVGFVAPCCLVAACGSSGPSSGSLSGKSPRKILALTTTAITAADSSFHFVDESRVGSKTTTLTGDDTATGATQSLTGDVAALTVERRADGSVFVEGAAEALQNALGLSQATATAQAGKWIELQSGDAPYSAVTAALAPKNELNTFVPLAPLTLGAPRSFHGRTVIGVSGTAPASAANGKGHVVTLYVRTEAPYTPVGATLTFGSGSSAGVEAVVFDRWGQRVDPPAPTGAVLFSSLS
jgi:hypothetical protein